MFTALDGQRTWLAQLSPYFSQLLHTCPINIFSVRLTTGLYSVPFQISLIFHLSPSLSLTLSTLLSVCPFARLSIYLHFLSLSLFVSISLSAYPCMNINSGEGSCVCSLRWAMTRCTNGIVESGSLLSLLQVS